MKIYCIAGKLFTFDRGELSANLLSDFVILKDGDVFRLIKNRTNEEVIESFSLQCLCSYMEQYFNVHIPARWTKYHFRGNCSQEIHSELVKLRRNCSIELECKVLSNVY